MAWGCCWDTRMVGGGASVYQMPVSAGELFNTLSLAVSIHKHPTVPQDAMSTLMLQQHALNILASLREALVISVPAPMSKSLV